MAKVHDAAVALLMFGEVGDAAADVTTEPSLLPSRAASTVGSPTRPLDTDAAALAGMVRAVPSCRNLDQNGESQPSTRAVSPIPQPMSFQCGELAERSLPARERPLTPVRAARPLAATAHGPTPPPPSERRKQAALPA